MVENMPQARWASREPWDDLLPAGLDLAGLKLSAVPARSLIHVAVGPADHEEFAGVVGELFATSLPKSSSRLVRDGLALSWAGLDQWFLTYDHREAGQSAEDMFNKVAALTDLSASRATLRLSGKNARKVLAKACPIDLHPHVFKPGDVAITTLFGHVGVHLTEIDDVPTYELAVFRSLVKSFYSSLMEAAREFP
jgi:methylglutamate dehydrogenase subunit D